ncbi:MAG: preprotein translocase subunit SecG [Oscillospiraceae bacterium]|jgi:preprotein translocase subunit SecG|nr:preprotein translocase subunit SecG [Oscillospiraceae bacterium]
MSSVEIFFGIMLVLFAIAIVTVVLFQEGKQSNSGVITGAGSDTFLTKNKSRSIDAFLARWTKFIAIMFFILIIGINVITFFNLFGM